MYIKHKTGRFEMLTSIDAKNDEHGICTLKVNEVTYWKADALDVYGQLFIHHFLHNFETMMKEGVQFCDLPSYVSQTQRRVANFLRDKGIETKEDLADGIFGNRS